jgi:alkanesulfonate monooxygenase SsuD/methylene tetrahydromethanopterin reductase-like flavin-dependent oxidoreductase (luciferase family)
MVASLYELSGGRYVLGIGAGWREEEYLEYGITFPSAAVRIRQLSEGVQIIKKLWTEDNVTFNGEYFQVNNLSCHPQPTPTPPIMIGGGGESLTLRVVAKYADWWNMGAGSLKQYKHKLKILSKHCSRVNRNFNEIRKTIEALVDIRETKKEAKEATSTNRRSHFVGTPKEAVNWLNGFIDAGVDYFILRFLDEPNTVGAQLFGERVIPELI